MVGTRSFTIKRKKRRFSKGEEKIQVATNAKAPVDRCVPCEKRIPLVHDASEVFKKLSTISKELDPETGRRTYKNVINTLTFLERAASATFIDVNTILASILERLEDLEGPILATMVYRKSAFLSTSTELDLEFEKKQKAVEEFLQEMSRVVILIHSLSEGKVCGPVTRAWDASISGTVPLGSCFDESSTQRFGNMLFNMISSMSPELEGDSTFRNVKLGIPRSSTVTHGMIRYPENDTSYIGGNGSTDQVKFLKEALLSGCMKNPGSNATNKEFVDTLNFQSISENPIHRCGSDIGKQGGEDFGKTKGSVVHSIATTSGVALEIISVPDKYRHSVFCEPESTSVVDDAFAHSNEPDLSGLTYFVHDPEQKTCVCSLGVLSCSRHLVSGPLDDVIILLCNSRADASSFLLLEDAYMSFLTCYPLVVTADVLIRRLVSRCNVLFRGILRNLCPLFKGSFLMLLDVVGSNLDIVSEPTYEGLWTLFIRLSLSGKIGCSKHLLGVILGLTSNSRTNSYNYTCKGILMVSKLVESAGAQQKTPSKASYNASIDVTVVDPCVIAQQITLMLEELLHNVTPQSFLVYSLEKSLPHDNAPSLLAKVFDKVANWIKDNLTMRVKTSDQVKLVQYFYKVGLEALNLNNLFLANAVAAALCSNQFYDLPCVRNNQSLLRPITSLNDQSHNFQYYRKVLSTSSQPRIPIFFVHDNDLRKIHMKHSKNYRSLGSLNRNMEDMNINFISCDSAVSCFSIGKESKGGASTCDSGTGTERSRYLVAGASDAVSTIMVDLSEMYEVRKYYHQYKLFEVGSHYRLEPRPDVLKIINDFSCSGVTRRDTMIRKNELSNGHAHGGI